MTPTPKSVSVSGRKDKSAYYMYLRHDSALLSRSDSPSVRADRVEVTQAAGGMLSGGVEIRSDCDCTICRTARGLKPFSTSELTAKREARR